MCLGGNNQNHMTHIKDQIKLSRLQSASPAVCELSTMHYVVIWYLTLTLNPNL